MENRFEKSGLNLDSAAVIPHGVEPVLLEAAQIGHQRGFVLGNVGGFLSSAQALWVVSALGRLMDELAQSPICNRRSYGNALHGAGPQDQAFSLPVEGR
jgi:hypothetical protein